MNIGMFCKRRPLFISESNQRKERGRAKVFGSIVRLRLIGLTLQ